MHGSKICGERRPDHNLGIPQHAISWISDPSHAVHNISNIALNCVSNRANKRIIENLFVTGSRKRYINIIILFDNTFPLCALCASLFRDYVEHLTQVMIIQQL